MTLTSSELARRFAGTTVGRSVRRLDLGGKEPMAVHAELVAAGFRAMRLPIPTLTSRAGQRRFVCVDGTATPDLDHPGVASEYVYVHADRGCVRVFPDGLASHGFATAEPCSRKSVLAPGFRDPRDFSLEAEAFVVTADGDPVPKSPRSEHGLRDHVDRSARRRAALELVLGSRVLLKKGPAPPQRVARDAVGLRVGRTVAPDFDFARVLAWIDHQVDAAGGLIARQQDRGNVHLLFLGHEDTRFERFSGHRGLAALTVNLGQFTIGVDPIGHGTSVEQLDAFVRALVAAFPSRIYDDASGANVTDAVASFPSFLAAPYHQTP